MTTEARLQYLESRIDQVSATNLELREYVDKLGRELRENRVELLALQNLVDRRLPARPPSSALQIPATKPSRPKNPVLDHCTTQLQLKSPDEPEHPRSLASTLIPLVVAELQSAESSLTTNRSGKSPKKSAQQSLGGKSSSKKSRSSVPALPSGSIVVIEGGKARSRYADKRFRVVGPKGTTYTYIVATEDPDDKLFYKANTSLSLAPTFE